jgi:hypothetical protein
MAMIDERERFERAFDQFRMPEPSWDRLVDRRHRKRRNQRVAAGVAGMAIFLAAIWFLSSRGLLHGARQPGGPRPTAPHQSPTISAPALHLDPTSLPPEGTPASLPTRGEVVLRFEFGHTFGDPGRVLVYVYADGRLLSMRWDGSREFEGWEEQRLTTEGVELVVSEVASTGLLDHDLDLTSTRGLTFGEIRLRRGDRVVRVAWGDHIAPGHVPAGTTQEQADALKLLDERLASPAVWLPATAWEDQTVKPFVASRYWISFTWRDQKVPSRGLSRLLDSLLRPAVVLLRAAGITRDTYTNRAGTYEYWYAKVSTEDARALDTILRDSGAQQAAGGLGPSYLVHSAGTPRTTKIELQFNPLLPDE